MDLRERRKATSEARNEAMRRLKAAHPEEFRAFYEEEAVKHGITPARQRRGNRIARLRAELARLTEGEDHAAKLCHAAAARLQGSGRPGNQPHA